MNRLFFPLLAAAALCTAGCSNTTDNDAADTDSVATTTDAPATASAPRRERITLNESDSYIDLRTGKPLRIRRNDAGMYVAEDGSDLNFFVNTTSGDTFYTGEARRANGYIMRSGADYTIDQTRWTADGMDAPFDEVRVEEDGDYKMKREDGDVKEKLKVDGDGRDVKYKYKDDATDTKIKATEDQVKVRDSRGRTEIESDGSVKSERR